MTLAELRKVAIRKNLEIRFPLRNGMQCVIGLDGVARIPALHAAPDFNLEQELAEAASFVLEAQAPAGRKPAPRTVTRAELTAMTADSPVAVAHDDHDDE